MDVNLTNCEQEPIHIPGFVQPHGVMLALRNTDLTIVQASANAKSLLGIPAEGLLGRGLDAFLGAEDVSQLNTAVREGQLSSNPLYLLTVRNNAGYGVFDGIAHRSGELIILELEASQKADEYSAPMLYRRVLSAISKVESAGSLAEMCDAVAEQVRLINGFDRVMVYKFDQDWNGAVVAEAKREDLEPFLGLNYPASDIPKQARELYTKNRLRFIGDRDYVPAALVPAMTPTTGKPLDMSFSVLRSVSSIHLEYLRNMGVRASMSISILKNGTLWGLIACHHYFSSRFVAFDVRTACELLGNVMSLQIAAKEDVEDQAYAVAMANFRRRLSELMESQEDYAAGLTAKSPNVLDFIHAGGAAVVLENRISTVGETPSEDQIREIANWLAGQGKDDVDGSEIFHTDSLSFLNAPFESMKDGASGLLAISLTRLRPHYVMWFRPEQVRTVRWAGDPAKSVTKGNDGVRLSPRGSFSLWKQTVRMKGKAWSRSEIASALDLRRDIVAIILRKAERVAKLYNELQDGYTQLDSTTSLLRQSEERLRLATSAGGVGIWDWDVGAGKVTLSDVYHRMAGIEHGEFDGTFEGFIKLIHEQDQTEVRESLQRAIADKTEFRSEYRLACRDAQICWAFCQGRFVYGPTGEALRMSGVAVDITERKKAELERAAALSAERTARSEAERTSRVKDEFLATLSHELRTPLNAIVGWAAMLRSAGMEVMKEDLEEGLEAIERNARVQAQLIEDLLDVSRIVSGKLRLDVQHVELVPIIEAAIVSVMPAAQNKGIRVQKELDGREAAVWGDPARLQQVLWNLLSNAIKFSNQGGKVSVRLLRADAFVEVSVTDEGKGISPEFLPHVFERFRQADSSTTRKYGGLGLGLAIARHLVEQHGGSVRAESGGPGTGSTFVIRVPLTARETPPDKKRGPQRSPTLGAKGEGPYGLLKGLRVLVVDDDADARNLIRRLLSECAVEVNVAASVAAAMEALKASRFDVLVSDIGMPDQDGYDLIRQLRAMPTDEGGKTPAVALTALARTEDRREVLMAGFQIHVPKPVDPAELLAVIASVTGRMSR